MKHSIWPKAAGTTATAAVPTVTIATSAAATKAPETTAIAPEAPTIFHTSYQAMQRQEYQ